MTAAGQNALYYAKEGSRAQVPNNILNIVDCGWNDRVNGQKINRKWEMRYERKEELCP